MSLNLLKDVKSAIAQLNPSDVRRLADRSISIGIVSGSEAGYVAMEQFLLSVGPASAAHIHRLHPDSAIDLHDVVLCAPGASCPRGAFPFPPSNAESCLTPILDAKGDLEIPLARQFPVFRQLVLNRIIQRTAKENAMFALVTALPNVVPNLLEIPWSVGEFAGDTAFLTINQVRMAFLIAAANGKPVGYVEQKMELASIAASALGWRAIARELIGKIPLGGGLVPKAAIAFAGTYVLGLGLERLHRTGSSMGRQESRAAYTVALERGKEIAKSIATGFKRRNAA